MKLGQVVGSQRRFTIVGEIGAGGTGRVYEATDERGVVFVVKEYLADDPDTVLRARILLDHERTILEKMSAHGGVQVHDADDRCLIISHIKGRTLAHELLERRRRGRLDVPGIADLFVQLAQFVYAMHELEGVVHRDLKPENVLVLPAADLCPVYIIDYASAYLDGTHPLDSNAFTVGYASPEQLRGGPVASSSDIYSLGVMLCEALTGTELFDARTTEALKWAHRTEAPDLTTLPSVCPTRLVTLIASMLDKEPARRPNALSVVRTLSQFRSVPRTVDAESTSRRTTGEVTARLRSTGAAGQRVLSRIASRQRLWLAGAAVLLFAVGTGAYVRKPQPTAATNPDGKRPARPAAQRSADECAEFLKTDVACVPAMELTCGNTLEDVERLCRHLGSGCTAQVKTKLLRSIDAHRVRLATFGMDRFEITCKQFLGYLNSSLGGLTWQKERVPRGALPLADRYAAINNVLAYDPGSDDSCIRWDGKAQRFRLADKRFANYPVDYVTQWGAEAYCEMQGGTLPTEAQVEAVARGVDNALYASRKTPQCSDVAFDQEDDEKAGTLGECRDVPKTSHGLQPVGTRSFDTVPGLGVHDLLGNVAEWTSDLLVEPYPQCTDGVCMNPHTPVPVVLAAELETKPKPLAIFRGTSFAMPRWLMLSSARGRRPADVMEHGLGFRCVRTPRRGGTSQ